MTDKTPPARPRPGHLELAQHRLRRARPHRRDGAARVPADLPAARAGSSTTRRRSGRRSSRPRARRWRKAGLGGRRHRRRSASPTSARRRCSGTARTGEPVYNAIVWQDRRAEPTCAALRERGLEPTVPREDRPRHRRLLLRHQAAVDPRPRRRRARRGRARRARLRHRRQLADVAADRRRRRDARRRVHATDVSNASRTLLFDMHAATPGTTSCSRCSTSRASCCRRCIRRATSTATRDADLLGAPIADRRRRRRPAERAVRPGLLQGRAWSKNTYGTGCFMLMHTGDRLPDLGATA